MRVLLVSINSLDENVGGSAYLKALYEGYSRSATEVRVVHKCILNRGAKNESKCIGLEKGIFSDLVSRLFFSPSFLFVYLPRILWLAREADIVAFHSSRLGLLAKCVDFCFKSKKVIVHFDNVESKLVSVRKSFSGLKSLVATIDSFLIPSNERIALSCSGGATFITSADAAFFGCVNAVIIPMCLDQKHEAIPYENRGYVLFTASFDFEPNIDALNDIVRVAASTPEIQYVVAGRALKNCTFDFPDNVQLKSDVAWEEMEALFMQASIYYSPVKLGSGMKTKVAEAISFGLPVVAHPHSLVGYEQVVDKNYIKSALTLTDAVDHIRANHQTLKKIEMGNCISDFSRFYSFSRVEVEVARLISE